MVEGYITCAYGREMYLEQAVNLACSIKRLDTKRPVALLTDSKIQAVASDYRSKGILDLVIVLARDRLAEQGIKPLPNDLNLHFSTFGGENLKLDLENKYCGFQKGDYWAEPCVLHYNSLASVEMYRSRSRKVSERFYGC